MVTKPYKRCEWAKGIVGRIRKIGNGEYQYHIDVTYPRNQSLNIFNENEIELLPERNVLAYLI